MHPVKTVPVSGNHMEKLDASIRQKAKQNRHERNESIIAAETYLVSVISHFILHICYIKIQLMERKKFEK